MPACVIRAAVLGAAAPEALPEPAGCSRLRGESGPAQLEDMPEE